MSNAIESEEKSDPSIESLQKWLGRNPVRSIATLLLLVIVVGAGFYVLSYNSVKTLTIQTESVTEGYRTGLLGYVEIDIKVRVMSSSSFDTTLSQVAFGLSLDDIPFPTIRAMSSTFSPGQYMEYTMRFTSYDSQDALYVSQTPTQNIVISITALVTSGSYSGWISTSYSHSFTFQSYNQG